MNDNASTLTPFSLANASHINLHPSGPILLPFKYNSRTGVAPVLNKFAKVSAPVSVIKLQPKSNIPIATPESNIASHRHLTNVSLIRLLNKYLCLPFNTTSTSSFPDAFCASNRSIKTDDGLVVTSLSPTIVKYAFDNFFAAIILLLFLFFDY